MTQTHPITPPPELVEQWEEQWCDMPVIRPSINSYMATQAAQWGADQELEACIDVLGGQWEWDILSQCTGWKEFRDESEDILRTARRPKPPSLKELALEQLGCIQTDLNKFGMGISTDTIRRALEAFDD